MIYVCYSALGGVVSLVVVWFVEPFVLNEVEYEFGREVRDGLKRKYRAQVRLLILDCFYSGGG
jgi:hypothetical protein